MSSSWHLIEAVPKCHSGDFSFSYEDVGAAKSLLTEFVILQGFGFYFKPGLAESDLP